MVRLPSLAASLIASSCVVVCVAACDKPEPQELPPPPVESVVTVDKEGDGQGVIRTDKDGILCDVDCDTQSFTFEDTESVVVTAEPGRNANFKVLHCSAEGHEELRQTTLDDNDRASLTLPTIEDGVGVDWSCGAEFLLVHTLQVIATQGTGSGVVTGSLSAVIGADEPKRIDCASSDTCVAAYFDGEVEVLTATPDDGSVFVRWDFCNSDDATNPVATLTMTQDFNCRPRFDPAP